MQIRRILPLLLLAPTLALVPALAQAPTKPEPATLRSTLLASLHQTHDTAEWFVPLNTAIAGLTPEQAKWTPLNGAGKSDPNANHSAGMLAYHLWFWNSRALAQLKGEKPGAAPSNNDETFNEFDATTWTKIVQDNDAVMKSLEQVVTNATDAQLAKIAPSIAHICTHNAYHIGQILYVRKLQGVWNPANGVK